MNRANQLLFLMLLSLSTIMGAQSFDSQNLGKRNDTAHFITSNLQDYDEDGDLDIIVGQDSPSGIYWLENEPTQQYPKHLIVSENINNIADVAVADFDNDGDMDYLVCMTQITDGELAWFQRQDDGNYIKWTIATDKDFIMAEVADLNGDGWLDIVAVGLINSDREGTIYINQGNLFFQEQIIATGNIYKSIAVNDIDNDGDVDIAFGGSGDNFGEEIEGARLMLNDGSGNFITTQFLHCWGDSYNDCGSNNDLKIIDLNNDGAKDIVGFSGVGTGGLYWLDGSNDFDQIRIDTDNSIVDLGGDFVFFDIDGNGFLDIVRQNYGQKRLSVLYQTSNMVFEREYIDLNWLNSGNPTAKMSVGDMDNDGDLDLIFPEKSGFDMDLSWFENIDGKLYKHYIYCRLDAARIPKFVDVDNDNDLDIVVTIPSGAITDSEDEVLLFENIDGENFINWRVHDKIEGAADIEAADIDGDGDMDLVITARESDDLLWLENTGLLYEWNEHLIEENANTPLGCSLSDIDGDGDIDIALCSWNDDKVFWYQNDGNGQFNKRIIAPLLDGPRDLEIADFDGDGDKDIAIVCSELGNTLAVYWNDGLEVFSQNILKTGKSGRDIELGDWNGDGSTDILITLYSNTNVDSPEDVVAFIYDDGTNTFTETALLIGAEKSLGIRLGDLDNDGDLDMLIGFDGNSRILAGIHDGDDIEVLSLSNLSRGSVLGIDLGDVNNDGHLDIVFADSYSSRDELILFTMNCIEEPTVDLGEDIQIQQGESIVLDATGPDLTYQWSTNVTSASITVTEAGTYSVTVTNAQGCSAVDEIMVSIITNVDDLNASQFISVMPNPTKNWFSITSSRSMSNINEISLLDVHGRKLFWKQYETGQSKIEVDLSPFHSGLYFILIKTDEGEMVKRIIKA